MSVGLSLLIPEGWLKIAQRFNVGTGVLAQVSPEGTTEYWARIQPSLRDLFSLISVPNVETLGYCRKSLRDSDHRGQLYLTCSVSI